MHRPLVAAWLAATWLLIGAASAAAAGPPFRTVIGPVTPAIAGLTLTGAPGGCDLFILNQTGQDVLLVDDGSPAQAMKFPSVPRSKTPPAPALVHLVGTWKCSALPGITEDQQWNMLPVTVLAWTLHGTAGPQQFRAAAQTIYDPDLDPDSAMLGYLRLVAGAAAVGGLLIGVPYLLMRRREILNG